MFEKQIIKNQDPLLNTTLHLTLISPILIQDYQLQKDGLLCYFTRPIQDLQVIIKSYLSALCEITNRQFYFEIINEHEALLKIYGVEPLQFSQEVLFNPSVSSTGRMES